MAHADRSSGLSLLARGAAILIAAASLSCAAMRAPLTSPARGGAAWNELTSRHFVLQSDIDAEDARATITEFEALRAALARVLPPPAIEPGGRIEIVLFDRKKDFYELTHRLNFDAYFTPQLQADLEARAVLVLQSALGKSGRALFLHELTHRFLHQRFVDVPTWLDEGLAQLYSTLRVQDGKITVGGRLRGADFSERPFYWSAWYDDGSQTQIPVSKAPTVRQLIDADQSVFYGARGAKAPTEKEQELQGVYYTAAWKLVQLLVNGPDDALRARFQRFLSAVERGAKPKRAFHDAFDEAEMDRLELVFRAYLTEVELVRSVFDYRPLEPAPVEREEVMSDARVHLLWARISPWTAETRGVVERELDAATASDPTSSEASFLGSIHKLRLGDFEGARVGLGQALARRPDDPRYLLGQLRWFQWRSSKKGEKNEDSAEIEAIVERLAHVAQTPTQLDAVARHYARSDRQGAAFAYVERALTLDPACWKCQDTRAIVLTQVHRVPEALAAIDRALTLLPESEDPERLLEHRRAILAAIAATPAPSRR